MLELPRMEAHVFKIPKQHSKRTSSSTDAGTKSEKLKLDSGAQQTIVRLALLTSNAYNNHFKM